MKINATLVPAACLAALLLVGCDNTASGPPKGDTTQAVQSGNNPSEAYRRPGMPPGAKMPGTDAGSSTANPPGPSAPSSPPRAGR